MRINGVLRQAVINELHARGGHCRGEHIRAVLLANEHDIGKFAVSRSIRVMLDDSTIIHAGKGVYWLPEAYAASDEAAIAKLPYGVRTEGRIIHLMLPRDLSRVVDIFASLRDAGHVKGAKTVYTALWQMEKDGYATQVSYGAYRLTQKARDAAGVATPEPPPETAHAGPWGKVIKPHVITIIRESGETSPMTVTRVLNARGYAVGRFQVCAVFRGLKRTNQIEKKSHGRYRFVEPVAQMNETPPTNAP